MVGLQSRCAFGCYIPPLKSKCTRCNDASCFCPVGPIGEPMEEQDLATRGLKALPNKEPVSFPRMGSACIALCASPLWSPPLQGCGRSLSSQDTDTAFLGAQLCILGRNPEFVCPRIPDLCHSSLKVTLSVPCLFPSTLWAWDFFFFLSGIALLHIDKDGATSSEF